MDSSGANRSSEGVLQKNPLTDQERKQRQRDRERLIRTGTYQAPLLEQAKSLLMQQEIVDLDMVLSLPQFSDGFGEDEIRQLKKFVQNIKYRQKLKGDADEKLRQQHLTIKERVSRIENQQASELHRSLLTAQTEKERASLILSKIEENKFLLLEYLQAYPPPTQDFLPILVGLRGRVDDMTFTQLLRRVCSLHKGEDLPFDEWMVLQVMEHLLEYEEDHSCAFGLLRLAFQNQISLTQFPLQMLLNFQRTYELTISNFYKALPLVKQFVIDQMPPTLFSFTTPILGCLRGGGDAFHKQLPLQYLPYIVEILCYSQSESQNDFDAFLANLREVSSGMYELLRGAVFQNLLQALVTALREMHPKFFRRLDSVTLVIKKGTDLLRDRRFTNFDQPTVHCLVEGDAAQEQMLSQRPRQIKVQNCKHITELHERAIQGGQPGPWTNLEHVQPLLPHLMIPFASMGIQQLLPSQEYAVRLYSNTQWPASLFLLYRTGQGKSALCLGLAALATTSGTSTTILNESSELTFRDFKAASLFSEKLGIPIELCKNGVEAQLQRPAINYCDGGSFDGMDSKSLACLLNDSLVIVDEFDSFLLGRQILNKTRSDFIKAAKRIVCVTGSDIMPHQQNYIKKQLKGSILDLRPPKTSHLEPRCLFSKIHTKIDAFRQDLVEICIKQTLSTPVVIINNSQGDRLVKQLHSSDIRCENLSKLGMVGMDGVLGTFTTKFSGRYPVFVINESQGRGMDFQTNPDVEKEGGVYVLIAQVPQSIQEMGQFIGRTGRIGNKGQYAVVLYDKLALAQDGDTYLRKIESKLRDEDLLLFSQVGADSDFFQTSPTHSTIPSAPHGDAIQNAKQIQCQTSGDTSEQVGGTGPQAEETKSPVDCSHQQFGQSLGNQSSPYIYNMEQPQLSSLQERRNNKWDGKQRALSRLQVRNEPANLAVVDSSYFEGYSKLDIHHEMKGDESRMNAYEQALRKVAAGKTVIDVGTGTAPLAIMAARAGAIKVIGIEKSAIFTQAKKEVQKSGESSKIVLHNMLAEEFAATGIKADVIVSEWMGYMLLYENMLPSVIAVRNQCLAPDGIMVPRSACLFIAAFAEPPLPDDALLKADLIEKNRTYRVDDCPFDWLCSNSVPVLNIDLLNDQWVDNNAQSPFSITINREELVSGLVAFFTVELCEGVVLSTSPADEPTHWHQVLFYFPEAIPCLEFGTLGGQMILRPQSENHRALEITFNIDAGGVGTPMLLSYSMD